MAPAKEATWNTAADSVGQGLLGLWVIVLGTEMPNDESLQFDTEGKIDRRKVPRGHVFGAEGGDAG